MKTAFYVLLTALALVSPVAAEAAAPSPANVKQGAVKAKGVWIDVRTPEEFSRGHLKGAVNIPMQEIGEKISSVSPDKNAPVNLYCHSGRRAQVALQTLQQMGYTHVINQGGYAELLDKGVR